MQETLFSMPKKAKQKKNRFDDYEGFLDKHKVKLTTDDCYTPEAVMQAVDDYVGQFVDLSKYNIVRPFKPKGDYEAEDYQENDIVIDNPPFSIISKIVSFYQENGIKFFLFAPHLTLFSPAKTKGVTAIVSGADITYHNGAKINTSFLSNLFEGVKIKTAPTLTEAIKKAQKKDIQPLPKYVYPREVLTVSYLQKLVDGGIDFEVLESEVAFVRELDCQKSIGKGIFGAGFLCSQAKAEQAKAEQAKIEFVLSEREKKIINNLGI